MSAYIAIRDKLIADFSDRMLTSLTNVEGSGTTPDLTILESSCKDAVAIWEKESRTEFDENDIDSLYDACRLAVLLLKNKADYGYNDALEIQRDIIRNRRFSRTAPSAYKAYRDSKDGSTFDTYFEF